MDWEKKIPSFDVVFQLDLHPDEAEEDVELTRDQKKILPFVDGVRTVDDIMNEAGLVEFETGKALYGLVQAGYVSRAGERSTGPPGRSQVRPRDSPGGSRGS